MCIYRYSCKLCNTVVTIHEFEMLGPSFLLVNFRLYEIPNVLLLWVAVVCRIRRLVMAGLQPPAGHRPVSISSDRNKIPALYLIQNRIQNAFRPRWRA